MSRIEVRMATLDDADALSRIHAETWEDTYVGQVPAALVHERVARARERDWSQHADLRVGAGGGVLVLVRNGEVAGFCEFGPTEDADDDERRVGHIMRLYVHPLHQGHGGGRLLIESACSRLARDGYEEATLWTLESESNRAHHFYAHLGWTLEDVRNAELPPDVRYRRRLTLDLSKPRSRPAPTAQRRAPRRCPLPTPPRPVARVRGDDDPTQPFPGGQTGSVG